MLSFMFRMVCGLFGWKRICACFFIVCLYMYCRWRSQEKVGKPLNGLTHHIFEPVSSQNLVSNVICCVFLCSMVWGEMWLFILLILVELLTITVTFFRWEVTVYFVDIGRIADNHCLNFLFKIQTVYDLILWS